MAAKLKYWARLCYNFLFTNKTRWLTVRVIFLTAWYRFLIRFVPMARLEEKFGRRGGETAREESLENLRYANLVGRRVERVSGKTAWESKCLVQALTARRILAKKGISTTLYLGLRKDNEALHAHAWLRCGRLSVTGNGGNGHTVVSFFSN